VSTTNVGHGPGERREFELLGVMDECRKALVQRAVSVPDPVPSTLIDA
jgi:hypothetical protein